MADIGTSLTSLVKSNNGYFKSEKQSAFLLSQCDNGEFCAGGSVWGSSYQIWYECDAKGVVNVKKQTHAKGLMLQWERVEEGKMAIQDSKEFKRLVRLLKGYVKSIEGRQASWDAGTYDAPRHLFDECQSRDIASVDQVEAMIDALSAH